MSDKLQISLGDTARDTVTGFEGVVTSIILSLHGSPQALVQPTVKDEGSWREARWFEFSSLSVIRVYQGTL